MYVNSNLITVISEELRLPFLVRNYSYMTLDYIFERIKKEIKKHETILVPNIYRDIFKNHETVKEFDKLDVFITK